MAQRTVHRLALLLSLSAAPLAAQTASPIYAPLRPVPGDYEVIFGDPEKAGEPFVMRIRELPGTIIPPHEHPVDEHITVLQGTFYFAVSETYDPSLLRELPAGSYAFAPRGSTMFGAAPEAAIVQVHGIGPFHIHWRYGLSTLDDSDASTRFKYARGTRLATPRGLVTVRQGYRSGDIIQYEVVADSGELYMVSESDAAPAPTSMGDEGAPPGTDGAPASD